MRTRVWVQFLCLVSGWRSSSIFQWGWSWWEMMQTTSRKYWGFGMCSSCCCCCYCGQGTRWRRMCVKNVRADPVLLSPQVQGKMVQGIHATERGGRKLNESKALISKKARFDPYEKKKSPLAEFVKILCTNPVLITARAVLTKLASLQCVEERFCMPKTTSKHLSRTIYWWSFLLSLWFCFLLYIFKAYHRCSNYKLICFKTSLNEGSWFILCSLEVLNMNNIISLPYEHLTEVE